ncbi:SH3 domain-containing protein [Streptomyces sp. NPDC057682]|uniref:SH3 domain-containing protein n=1 Tax=Streptomyces sp. NPDC057682 TaxID=3346210 RepID=UPI0036B66947
MTRSRALAVGGALLAGVLAAGAGTASAAPRVSGDTAAGASRTAAAAAPSAAAATYTVNIWAQVNQRSGPHTTSTKIGTLGLADNPHYAQCWTYGDKVVAEGYTNNIWLKVQNKASGKWGYSSAIYFKGNERGNLPVSAKC